jgi:hypothetical protein
VDAVVLIQMVLLEGLEEEEALGWQAIQVVREQQVEIMAGAAYLFPPEKINMPQVVVVAVLALLEALLQALLVALVAQDHLTLLQVLQGQVVVVVVVVLVLRMLVLEVLAVAVEVVFKQGGTQQQLTRVVEEEVLELLVTLTPAALADLVLC